SKERPKSLMDSSRTNKKQNTLLGSIADNGNQQNQGNELTAWETTDGNNAGNSVTNPTTRVTTDNHTQLAMLTTLPAQATLSAGQNRIYNHNTNNGSYSLLLLMAVAATTVICIVAITAKVTSKKKNAG
ncbi:MAG: hypothetical protein K2N77_04000, partial [Lachnospiraceae bacterium]|nr:hypothetical protein [Lachnospiraceae bacterium]